MLENRPPSLDRHSRPARPPKRALMVFLALGLAHVGLAAAIRASPGLGVLHAAVAAGIGVLFALDGRKPQRVANVVAYIVGAEVFWRMTKTPLPWEAGKLLVSAIVGLALLRRFRSPPLAPLLYFVLLLPSIAWPLAGLPLEEARQQIGANLSGPFCLSLCLIYFQRQRFTQEQLARALAWLVLPVFMVSTAVLLGIRSARVLEFGTKSNFAAAGGWGPNQVSAMLSLAALALFLFFTIFPASRRAKLLSTAGIVALLAQAALTFSRGGIYMFGAAVLAASLLLSSTKGARRNVIAAGIVLALVTNFVALPRFDAYTGGAFTERFRELATSGRIDIMKKEVNAFVENPIAGVGPGYGNIVRKKHGMPSAAHTEFTRMLAEHGVLGLFSLILLIHLCWGAFRRQRGRRAKAFSVAFIAWAVGFMLVNAMRLAAPAFAIGFASAHHFIENDS